MVLVSWMRFRSSWVIFPSSSARWLTSLGSLGSWKVFQKVPEEPIGGPKKSPRGPHVLLFRLRVWSYLVPKLFFIRRLPVSVGYEKPHWSPPSKSPSNIRIRSRSSRPTC
eukprot:3892747-Pyramimonas_sp.AAC.1